MLCTSKPLFQVASVLRCAVSLDGVRVCRAALCLPKLKVNGHRDLLSRVKDSSHALKSPLLLRLACFTLSHRPPSSPSSTPKALDNHVDPSRQNAHPKRTKKRVHADLHSLKVKRCRDQLHARSQNKSPGACSQHQSNIS